jgi:hypothetical protein
MVIPDAPQTLAGDNIYDSDKSNSKLRRYEMELIVAYHGNQKKIQHLRALCDGIADVRRLNGCLP